MRDEQQRIGEKEASTSLRGERAALTDCSDEEAAERLLSTDAMLHANPGRESVQLAHIEALICCRSYTAAMTACRAAAQMGGDRLYLLAEAQWRSGALEDAQATLQLARGQLKEAGGKCMQLAAFVSRLQVSGLDERWRTD